MTGGFMQLPIVSPAPIVSQHAEAFRDLFHDPRQYRHFQNYLTGLMVLEDKSLANISRCTLESADQSNLSRFLSDAPWLPEAVNQRRVAYMLSQTVGIRPPTGDSYLILDDTLCEHVGSLFEYVERHYNHSDDTYPLAHNLVTSYYLSGAVRFPVDYALYRRYESVTDWARFVTQRFPGQVMPQTAKERAKLHRQLDQELRQDPEFERLHQQFHSKITIAGELIKQAIQQGLPFSTLLFDSWYLSPDLVALLTEYHKDWVSLLKSNRNLEVHSFVLNDERGQPVPLEGPHIQVADLVPLIPTQSYRPIRVNDQTYWCFSFCVRIPSLGKVRLVISFDNPHGSGTYATLVTNRTDWSAQQVLTKYLWRWPVETFYRDSKQLLGLEDYRVRSLEAMQAHWCLVFVAYSLLHLACLPPPSNRQGKRPAIPNQSIGAICRQQGQALIQALILFAHDRLQQGQSAAAVFQELFAKQQPEVMA
jgi:SRSO17 transposase